MVSCLALLRRTHALHRRADDFCYTACGLGIPISDSDENLFAIDPESASCEQCQQALEALTVAPAPRPTAARALRGVAMSPETQILDPLTVRSRVLELLDEFHGRIDRGASIADLLDEQAKFKTPVRNAEGREAFAALMLSLFEMRRQKGRTARHVGANVNIEDLGSGQYRVRSLIIVLAADSGAGAQGFVNVGDHVDIVKIDSHGACRFVERTMTPTLQFSLAVGAGGP